MIRPEDDRFHPHDADPYWNESAFFGYHIPDRHLSGNIYHYHRPNMSLSAGGPAIWGPPDGEEIYDCTLWDWNPCQPLPPGADMFDCRLDNGLIVETVELQQEYRFSYKRNGCELDLTWSAIAPPNLMPSQPGRLNRGVQGWVSHDGSGPGQGDLTVGHFDQFGRVHGVIDIGTGPMQVDCFSMRDRSWGPRPLKMMPRASYSWGISSATSGFLAWGVSENPVESDPVIGTVEPIVYGLYLKDGIVGQLISGKTWFPERGKDGRPLRQLIDATDNLGRRLEAEGRNLNLLKWTGYADCFTWLSLVRWQFDGVAGHGEWQNYMRFAVARRLLGQLRG